MEKQTQSDFIKLSEDKKEWVRLSRETNMFNGIMRLLTELYPDNAHFVYELLQNAQDTNKDNQIPTTVRFILSKDELEFEHYGKKKFDFNDVKAITSIGEGTKREDRTNIGKFGAGFKSVFAYTDTPRIHSGSFHFQITDLVVPEQISPIHSEDKTQFIFPFNKAETEKSASKAVSEIERELRGLGSESLLFLKSINKIEYLLPDGDTFGYMERITEPDGLIRIKVSAPNVGDDERYWLRYEDTITVSEENNIPVECTISIAYRVVKNTKDGRNTDWRIEAINPKPGNVFIYFPAVKENSGLRFYINAPFASTVARDSVRECEENRLLCEGISDLVTQSLWDIKERGLLTMDFLAVLPNIQDEMDPQYEPIRRAIISAFQNEPLVPTKNGSHASAKSLYYGPAKISEVIDDADLSLLTGYNTPLWAKNPQQLSSREDRFLKSLGIEEWGYEELESTFNPYDEDEIIKIDNWLEKKSDQWLMRLFALLDYAYDEHDVSVDNELRIVRTTNNKLEKASNVYFASDYPKNMTKKPNFVKPETFDSGTAVNRKKAARSFLVQLGVKEYTEAEKEKMQVSALADKYAVTTPNVPVAQHLKDIKRFLGCENFTELLDEKLFVLDENDVYRAPNSVCSPIIDVMIEEMKLQSDYKKFCVSNHYEVLDDNEYDKFISIIGEMGAMTKLSVVLDRNYYKIDYTIPMIEKIIAILPRSVNKIAFAKLIWDATQQCNFRDIENIKTRPDGRYSFRIQYNTPTTIVKILSENAWIPDKAGRLYLPKDISVEMLPDGFEMKDGSSRLFDALNFGKSIQSAEAEADAKKMEQQQKVQQRDEALRILGITRSEFEILETAKAEGVDPFATVSGEISKNRKSKQPVFPQRTVSNPERRANKIAQSFSASEKISYELRERSVRTTASSVDPRIMLRSEYTNDDGEMVCQICQEEMPFKGRDEQYYFEAVEAFDIANESEQNHLALCPLCAAKFKEFIKRDKRAWKELADVFCESSDSEIPVLLDGEISIRFTEAHMHDLKIILLENERNASY